jgi:murein DD-endopeptidase MepM/ murein hydrolase activator NlpD
MRRFIQTLVFLGVVNLSVPALDAVTGVRITVTLDNKYIQTYRGRVGRWVKPESDSLEKLAREFGTTVSEIQLINDQTISRNEYVFIPMGEEFYQSLLRKGYGRRILHVDPRRLIWPAETPEYTSRFGRRFSEMHLGLDVAAPVGTPVLAADDGEVVGSSWMGGLGKTVMILHPDGKKTVYAHNSELLLKVGERVNRGQIIAFSGSTGRSTGPHIHFEVRYQDVALNPEDFLPYGFHQSEIIVREDVSGIAVTETLPDIRSSSSLPPRTDSL